jgi:hypothetical protein
MSIEDRTVLLPPRPAQAAAVTSLAGVVLAGKAWCALAGGAMLVIASFVYAH